MAVIFWFLRKKSNRAKTFFCIFVFITVFSTGHYLGSMWESLKYQEQYIFQFSRYSVMLRSLAERQEISALTNAVIMFDEKFNPNHEARDLEEAVREILKNDPSFQK